jgi:hypothetical protein
MLHQINKNMKISMAYPSTYSMIPIIMRVIYVGYIYFVDIKGWDVLGA